MSFEDGDHVGSGGAVALHAGDAELEDMARVPHAGALVHVLVEPLFTGRQMELLDQAHELRVDGPKQRDAALQERDRHKVGRRKTATKVIDAMGEEGVETVDGATRGLHGGRGEER